MEERTTITAPALYGHCESHPESGPAYRNGNKLCRACVEGFDARCDERLQSRQQATARALVSPSTFRRRRLNFAMMATAMILLDVNRS